MIHPVIINRYGKTSYEKNYATFSYQANGKPGLFESFLMRKFGATKRQACNPAYQKILGYL